MQIFWNFHESMGANVSIFSLFQFILLVSFYTPKKHQKASGFLMFLGGLERDQWHKMDYWRVNTKTGMAWVKRDHTFSSSHLRCSVKEPVFKIFIIFTGKHFCWSLFLIKLQAFRLSLVKSDSNTGVFLLILWNF